MSMSGIGFTEKAKQAVGEVTTAASKLKSDAREREFCFLSLKKHDGKKDVIEFCDYLCEKSEIELEDIIEALKDHQEVPHWIAVKVDLVLDEGGITGSRGKDSVLLIFYCPDTLSIQLKMKSASTHATVKTQVGPQLEVKINAIEELTVEHLESACKEADKKNKVLKVAVKHSKKK